MKTTKINKYSNMTLKIAFVFVGLLMVNIIFAQPTGGTHPGYDPIPVPIDGGILMAILALGGLGSMLLKKKKDNK
jgi:hypothetical protein